MPTAKRPHKEQSQKAETSDLAALIESSKRAWTVPEMAKLLSISKQEMYNMVREGRLPAYRIGTLIRLDPKQTAEWLRSKRTV